MVEAKIQKDLALQFALVGILLQQIWPNVSIVLLILLFLWLTSPPLPCRRKFLRAAVTGG